MPTQTRLTRLSSLIGCQMNDKITTARQFIDWWGCALLCDMCPAHYNFRFSFFVSFGDEVTKISCHFQAKTVQLIFLFFVILTKNENQKMRWKAQIWRIHICILSIHFDLCTNEKNQLYCLCLKMTADFGNFVAKTDEKQKTKDVMSRAEINWILPIVDGL